MPAIGQPPKKPKKAALEVSRMGIAMFAVAGVLGITAILMGYVTVRRFVYKHNMTRALRELHGARFPSAVDYAVTAAGWASGTPDPWIIAGVARTRQGDFAGAREAFQNAQAARVSPPVPAAHVGFGIVALREADQLDPSEQSDAIEARIAEAEGHFAAAGGGIEARIGAAVCQLARGTLLGRRSAVDAAASALEPIRQQVEAGEPVRWGAEVDLYAALAAARAIQGDNQSAAAFYFTANALAPDSPSLLAGAISMETVLLLQDVLRPSTDAGPTSVEALTANGGNYGQIIASELGGIFNQHTDEIEVLRPSLMYYWGAVGYIFAVRGRLNPSLANDAVRRFCQPLARVAMFANSAEAPMYSALGLTICSAYRGGSTEADAAAAYADALAHHALHAEARDPRLIAVLNNNYAAHKWNAESLGRLPAANMGALEPVLRAIEAAYAAAPDDPALRYHILRNRAVIVRKMSTRAGMDPVEVEDLRRRSTESWTEAEGLAQAAGVPSEQVAEVRRFMGLE